MTSAARPNVIVILVDTLRADHLSCYGYGRPTSPGIDRIAEHGVLYENAISPAAWTPPAHASLFTGTYPSRHGVERSRLVLSPELSPLPEVLQSNGYRTFGVSSNYWLSRETRFDRGFDEFIHSWQLLQTDATNIPLQRQQRQQDLGLDTLEAHRTNQGLLHASSNLVNKLFEQTTRKFLRKRFHAYDDGAWRVNQVVKRWVPTWQRLQDPFFAFIHYMEPHIRYGAPGRFYAQHMLPGVDARRIDRVNQNPWRYISGEVPMDEEDFAILSSLYDGEISYVDHKVSQLHGLLRDQGLLDDTVLVITSDHGENLGEHDLMDHQYCLYDTLLHVPLIVCFPPEFSAGDRVTQQVQTLDLFPTILQLAGIRDDSAWGQVQGASLLPSEIRCRPERVAFAESLEPQPPLAALRKRYPAFDGSKYDRALRTVRTNEAKYIWASDGHHELYRLGTDTGEERNIASADVDTAARMQMQLEQWSASFPHATRTNEAVEFDAPMLKRLADLGYI